MYRIYVYITYYNILYTVYIVSMCVYITYIITYTICVWLDLRKCVAHILAVQPKVKTFHIGTENIPNNSRIPCPYEGLHVVHKPDDEKENSLFDLILYKLRKT